MEWKSMQELSADYAEAASMLSRKLKELSAQLRNAQTAEERWKLKVRIADLRPMLTEMNKTKIYCEKYYERGFYTGFGIDGVGYGNGRIRKGNSEQVQVTKNRGDNGKRTNTTAGNVCAGMSIPQENIYASWEGKRPKQEQYLQNLLPGFATTD